jgi:hypothetical protein
VAVRRSLLILPFLCILGGLAIAELARISFGRSKVVGSLSAITLTLVFAVIVRTNYVDFFDKTSPSDSVAYTFGVDYRDMAEYIATLPDDAYVILFCDRWSITYVTGQLIAPDVRGEDRLPNWGGSGGLEFDPSLGSPVFVFMSGHQDQVAQVEGLYPGGDVVVGPVADYLDAPSFIAYLAPSSNV